MFFETALIAYLTDMIFGEFSLFPHPVVIMGHFIRGYEKILYKDSIFMGGIVTLLLTSITFYVATMIQNYIPDIFVAIIASTTIAGKMLSDAVREIIKSPNKIKYLVSRDTESLTSSDINKAAIETYAENLSDGVIAPLFYLILFGLPGALCYKAINTLDSMIGYRNKRYERFGKIAARIDDILNFIPARLTALLIAILFFSKSALIKFIKQGRQHESINAGYPIASMALSLKVKLGGDTSYFGKIKKKPIFGCGKEDISKEDILRALKLHNRINILIIAFLSLLIVKNYLK